jgi:hypothetical protein
MLLYQKYVAGSKGHPKVLMPHRPFQWPFLSHNFNFILFLSVQEENGPTKTHTRRSCETNSPARRDNNAHALPRPASILSSWKNNDDNSSSSKKDGEIKLAFDALCPPILHLRSGIFSRFLCSRFCAGGCLFVVCGKFVFALLLWGI